VVSETLLAMIEKPAGFEGRSSLRTYATGILKHKIVDLLRRRGREVPLEPVDDQATDDAIDALFVKNGHWVETPPVWHTPDGALQQAQFLDALQTCIERLPSRTARVFMLRESLEQEVDEICAELGINANYCGVLLYRARMALRECLSVNWFDGRRA
jgi:RNA polymerase sigma-70 factor (ECF subfamily)